MHRLLRIRPKTALRMKMTVPYRQNTFNGSAIHTSSRIAVSNSYKSMQYTASRDKNETTKSRSHRLIITKSRRTIILRAVKQRAKARQIQILYRSRDIEKF